MKLRRAARYYGKRTRLKPYVNGLASTVLGAEWSRKATPRPINPFLLQVKGRSNLTFLFQVAPVAVASAGVWAALHISYSAFLPISATVAVFASIFRWNKSIDAISISNMRLRGYRSRATTLSAIDTIFLLHTQMPSTDFALLRWLQC